MSIIKYNFILGHPTAGKTTALQKLQKLDGVHTFQQPYISRKWVGNDCANEFYNCYYQQMMVCAGAINSLSDREMTIFSDGSKVHAIIMTSILNSVPTRAIIKSVKSSLKLERTKFACLFANTLLSYRILEATNDEIGERCEARFPTANAGFIHERIRIYRRAKEIYRILAESDQSIEYKPSSTINN